MLEKLSYFDTCIYGHARNCDSRLVTGAFTILMEGDPKNRRKTTSGET